MYSNNPCGYRINSYETDIRNNIPISNFCKKREDVTCLLLTAKKNLGLTFADIANQIGASKEWIAAVIMGQESMNRDDSLRLAQLLQVNPYVADILQEAPMRGSIDRQIPTDPLIYRFYEIMQVYGTTFKALINEMFGDGIISAIDLKISVDKKPDPKNPKDERVVVTLDGKFLPYEKW